MSHAVYVLCIVISFGAIPIATCYTRDITDGARGGAIADIIALVILFLDRSYTSRIHKFLTYFQSSSSKEPDKAATIGDVEKIVRDRNQKLLEWLDNDARILKTQNAFLAAATATGTFFWGFGDKIAKNLLQQSCSKVILITLCSLLLELTLGWLAYLWWDKRQRDARSQASS